MRRPRREEKRIVVGEYAKLSLSRRRNPSRNAYASLFARAPFTRRLFIGDHFPLSYEACNLLWLRSGATLFLTTHDGGRRGKEYACMRSRARPSPPPSPLSCLTHTHMRRSGGKSEPWEEVERLSLPPLGGEGGGAPFDVSPAVAAERWQGEHLRGGEEGELRDCDLSTTKPKRVCVQC